MLQWIPVAKIFMTISRGHTHFLKVHKKFDYTIWFDANKYIIYKGMSHINFPSWAKTIYKIAKFNINLPTFMKPAKPTPLGRWIVNDINWELRAEYATMDSCRGNIYDNQLRPYSLTKGT
tara:strand:+ start:51 stop:410 length:360 start_codon:yes stop_codon:yes gene_type:complete